MLTIVSHLGSTLRIHKTQPNTQSLCLAVKSTELSVGKLNTLWKPLFEIGYLTSSPIDPSKSCLLYMHAQQQGCVLSPLMFNLYPLHCTPRHQKNSVVNLCRWRHHHWPNYKQRCNDATMVFPVSWCMVQDRKDPPRMTKTAQDIIGTHWLSIWYICLHRAQRTLYRTISCHRTRLQSSGMLHFCFILYRFSLVALRNLGYIFATCFVKWHIN